MTSPMIEQTASLPCGYQATFRTGARRVALASRRDFRALEARHPRDPTGAPAAAVQRRVPLMVPSESTMRTGPQIEVATSVMNAVIGPAGKH
jgi:hypothetical protein